MKILEATNTNQLEPWAPEAKSEQKIAMMCGRRQDPIYEGNLCNLRYELDDVPADKGANYVGKMMENV